ncbi:MAG: DegV family protein [Anaerolineae bacterium]
MTQRSDVIRIVTDSSCDLPRTLLSRFKIAIVPLVVHFGTESYFDPDLSPREYWAKAAEGFTPQTSQPSVGVFEEIFERLVEQGKQVLCITLTGKHSGTADTARLAAERFREAVRVFDSYSLSLGVGFQALAAAKAAEAGCSMEDLVALLGDIRSRIRHAVVLDTLESVRRGGRADSFIAIVDRMTRMLDIKPIVGFDEGRLQLMGVARSFRRALGRVADMMEGAGPLEYLGVAHTRSTERAEELADRLAERLGFPRESILVREAGAVVASHAGMGAMGVFALPVGARRECE